MPLRQSVRQPLAKLYLGKVNVVHSLYLRLPLHEFLNCFVPVV